MYFAKHITNDRCVDDIMYVHFSSYESESNSAMCNLLSASKLVLRVAKIWQLISEFCHHNSLMYIFDISAVLVVFLCGFTWLLRSISRECELILKDSYSFKMRMCGTVKCRPTLQL